MAGDFDGTDTIMTSPSSSFLDDDASIGPWLQDDEAVVYHHVRSHVISVLKKHLLSRLEALDIDNGITDDIVMLEIRRTIAECAVSGHITMASDLNDLAMDLLTAKEHTRRL